MSLLDRRTHLNILKLGRLSVMILTSFFMASTCFQVPELNLKKLANNMSNEVESESPAENDSSTENLEYEPLFITSLNSDNRKKISLKSSQGAMHLYVNLSLSSGYLLPEIKPPRTS